ncbi:hypothetical protein [Streptomyces sp. NBC_00467]|uniref:hypothetical protein n=1 Tax=Streptomyces sp. NBC_00467 TaxID=2975752 RepID=UPI002E18980F
MAGRSDSGVGRDDYAWVVWRIKVDDPGRRVASSESSDQGPGLAEQMRQPMTELAASLGCVYLDCCDDDTYENDVQYYAWWIRVPAAEHARLADHGLPVAVHRLHRYLADQLPDLQHWEVAPDRDRTVDHAASSALREDYEDLLAPFECALMPLRRDGAEKLDPRATVWRWEKDLLVGSFDLWLCDDPVQPSSWLVATVGLWTEPQLFDEEPAARHGHFGFTPHQPLLFLPRPQGPSTFTARIQSGAFPGRHASRAPEIDASGAAHQWTANDPIVLADRIAHDVRLLWPHLSGLAGGA